MTHMTHARGRSAGSLAILMAAVASTALLARDASAQPSLEPWIGLRSTHLQTVYVLDGSGTETKGRLLSLTSDALLLLVEDGEGSERRFARTDIVRLQTRDSLKNGATIGAIAGLLAGLLVSQIGDCVVDTSDRACAGPHVGFLLFSTAIYAGLGTGIDAAIAGRSTLYAAPPSVRPSLARTVGGPSPRPLMRVGVSW